MHGFLPVDCGGCVMLRGCCHISRLSVAFNISFGKMQSYQEFMITNNGWGEGGQCRGREKAP